MTPLPTVSSLLLSAMLMALERNSSSEADPSPPTGPLAVLSSAPEWFREPQGAGLPRGWLWDRAGFSPKARISLSLKV